MSTFNAVALAGGRTLVNGQDDNFVQHSTILDSSQWEELKEVQSRIEAGKEMDDAIREFYSPLTELAEKLKAKATPVDEAFFVKVAEAVPAVEGKAGVQIALTKDSVILRLLESGDTSRLIWVGDTIEILALA